MKKIFFLVVYLSLQFYYNTFSQCSESANAYKNLGSTVNLSGEIDCANGDVVLNEVGSDAAGNGVIIFDQSLTFNSFLINFQNGNKPAQFIIPAGITITITTDLTFSGQPNKNKFLVVEGTLIVGGTMDLGDIEFEIDGTGTIDAGEITGGDNTTCTNGENGGTGTCPTITTPVCNDTGGLCTEDSALPIELLFFLGFENNDAVLLSWATASEENFDYFSIERSADGIDFKEIAKVDGSGESMSRIEYDYIDEFPLEGISYYRLRSMDFDGYNEVFETVIVQMEGLVKDFNIYPNPIANGSFRVQTNFAATESVKLVVYNNLGTLEKEFILGSWLTTHELETSKKGIYLFQLFTPDGTIVKRVLVN